jgi:hypothetical protein
MFKESDKTLQKIYTILFEQVVCHIVALPSTLKGILKPKKNYENSNISPCKYLEGSCVVTNLKFQHKPKYHLSKSSCKNRPTST